MLSVSIHAQCTYIKLKCIIDKLKWTDILVSQHSTHSLKVKAETMLLEDLLPCLHYSILYKHGLWVLSPSTLTITAECCWWEGPSADPVPRRGRHSAVTRLRRVSQAAEHSWQGYGSLAAPRHAAHRAPNYFYVLQIMIIVDRQHGYHHQHGVTAPTVPLCLNRVMQQSLFIIYSPTRLFACAKEPSVP